jgi:hypothetical protein
MKSSREPCRFSFMRLMARSLRTLLALYCGMLSGRSR